jgi:dTDP-4-amino-4,6-dideoxygalactose transaminase
MLDSISSPSAALPPESGPETAAAVPMLNLRRQQESLGEPLRRAIEEALAATDYLPGIFSPDPASPFEKKLARYCGRRYAVGVGSGSAALHLALLAAGIGPGDEVLTVPNSFFATTEAILQVGARPVFIDVEEDTLLISLPAVEAALGPRVRAVLPVHLYGNVVDVEALQEILRRRGRDDVLVLEDCAHAMGAHLRGRSVPIGPLGAFSFNPVKNIGGLGDAGAVVTDDLQVASRARLLGNHGRAQKDVHVRTGFNSRLGGLDDRVLALKIEHLDAWNGRRQLISEHYRSVFREIPEIDPVAVPPRTRPAWYQHVIRVGERDALREHLRRAGIATGVHYPTLIPDQEALQALGFSSATVPAAARRCREILSLPCYAELTDGEVERVAETVASFFIHRKGRT